VVLTPTDEQAFFRGRPPDGLPGGWTELPAAA
jgi:hypothetical protein